jgi:hypothetical protein
MLPALKLESLSERQDLALMGFLLVLALLGIIGSPRTATIIAAIRAPKGCPGGVVSGRGRKGFRDTDLSALSWNLGKRHAALHRNPYEEY